MNYREYLFAKLMSESSEVIQDAEKIFMFGPDSYNPESGVRNDDKLIHEIHDVLAVIEMLHENGFLHFEYNREKIVAKKRKMISYAKTIGALSGEMEEAEQDVLAESVPQIVFMNPRYITQEIEEIKDE